MSTLKNRFLLISFIFKRFSFLLLLTVGITVGLSAQERQVASDTQLQQPQSSNQVQSSQSVDEGLDTLTEVYSEKWQGVETGEELSAVEQVLGSNNLIFVVLTVSLIIWFVLLTFLIRLDKKVARIEKSTLK